MSGNASAYKIAFTKHRRRPGDKLFANDLDDVVDFGAGYYRGHSVKIIPHSESNNSNFGGPIFCLHQYPGFMYLPNALSESFQKEIALLSLSKFCEPPHLTNIDNVPKKRGEETNVLKDGSLISMWDLYKSQLLNSDSEFRHKPINNTENNIERNAFHYYRSFDKLSWATLGYHYDWTNRSYREDFKSPMPEVLSSVGTYFSRVFNDQCLQDNVNESKSKPVDDNNAKRDNFKASAAIVNYYNTKSNMGGHRDDLELDLTKPVISLSVGLPAIFLLGGKTKEDEPVIPILFRPGDVMILGGCSRLNYHGIARILPSEIKLNPLRKEYESSKGNHQIHSISKLALNKKNKNSFESDDKEEILYSPRDISAVNTFLHNHRININLRQVLPDGMEVIP
mmetsp:Transcript_14516/g.20694  ORF Transcript_14516/g.20694 Transcript_14516/m.20694 type:complete len:395 (+) Transcript_14516:120-1304(+)